jgi:hypothetical protein
MGEARRRKLLNLPPRRLKNMSELKVLGPDGKVIPPKEAVKGIPVAQKVPAVQTLFQVDLIQSPEGPQYGLKSLQPMKILEVMKILNILIGVFIKQMEDKSNIILPG